MIQAIHKHMTSITKNWNSNSLEHAKNNRLFFGIEVFTHCGENNVTILNLDVNFETGKVKKTFPSSDPGENSVLQRFSIIKQLHNHWIEDLKTLNKNTNSGTLNQIYSILLL